MAKFGDLLKKLRGGRSQKDVARDLGMPITTLSTLENQESIPRGNTLKRLADFYGVPITYFYSAPTAELRSTESAKEWLISLRRSNDFKEGLATHAPPHVSDRVKQAISAAINERKNANLADDE